MIITRDNNDETITGSYSKSEELANLLKANNIIIYVSKDCLGFRVGIVNKEGIENKLRIENFLPDMADHNAI